MGAARADEIIMYYMWTYTEVIQYATGEQGENTFSLPSSMVTIATFRAAEWPNHQGYFIYCHISDENKKRNSDIYMYNVFEL